ncbi:MAG: alkaline phosphatase D family protein, partial [Bacteroidota bacterium]
MRTIPKKIFFLLIILIISCTRSQKKEVITENNNEIEYDQNSAKELIISFSSCDNQRRNNTLWKEILISNPDVFIWGGDIVYSDTYDMDKMRKNYLIQKNDSVYLDFIKKVDVLGTWDDHDYGKNDAGEEYKMKDSVQQIFLDFFEVPIDDIRRTRKGVYFSKEYKTGENSVKVIVLDTRYFRTELTRDRATKKRYKPNKYGEGTMLGKEQWDWLKNELDQTEADFNIIVSSIQFLSYEHGFETWGNFPHEVEKFDNLILDSGAKGVIILSGDRHIAEISSKNISGVNYPLIDFTASGMTHSYKSFSSEANEYRVSDVISDKNFGILKFDFINN